MFIVHAPPSLRSATKLGTGREHLADQMLLRGVFSGVKAYETPSITLPSEVCGLRAKNLINSLTSGLTPRKKMKCDPRCVKTRQMEKDIDLPSDSFRITPVLTGFMFCNKHDSLYKHGHYSVGIIVEIIKFIKCIMLVLEHKSSVFNG